MYLHNPNGTLPTFTKPNNHCNKTTEKPETEIFYFIATTIKKRGKIPNKKTPGGLQGWWGWAGGRRWRPGLQGERGRDVPVPVERTRKLERLPHRKKKLKDLLFWEDGRQREGGRERGRESRD